MENCQYDGFSSRIKARGKMNKEILTVVEVVSNEKGVDREIIFQALESAIASATKKRFPDEIDCRVSINRDDGTYRAFRRWEIIDLENYKLDDDLACSEDELIRINAELDKGLVPFPERQISKEALDTKSELKTVDGFLEDELEPAEFGRIAAQAAKQVIVQKVREAERAKIVEAYKSRIGELVMGIVKRVDRGNVIVDLGGNAEAVIYKEHMIPREVVRSGDRVRGYLYDVRPEKGAHSYL